MTLFHLMAMMQFFLSQRSNFHDHTHTHTREWCMVSLECIAIIERNNPSCMRCIDIQQWIDQSMNNWLEFIKWLHQELQPVITRICESDCYSWYLLATLHSLEEHPDLCLSVPTFIVIISKYRSLAVISKMYMFKTLGSQLCPPPCLDLFITLSFNLYHKPSASLCCRKIVVMFLAMLAQYILQELVIEHEDFCQKVHAGFSIIVSCL